MRISLIAGRSLFTNRLFFGAAFLSMLLVFAGISFSSYAEERGTQLATFFSKPGTGNTEIRDNLIELIDGARYSIDAHFYQVNCPYIIDAFCRAARRLPSGKVRFITDNHYRHEPKYEDGYHKMEQAGIKLIDDSIGDNSGRYESHNKFAVFDGQWVWTGSFNITTNGYQLHNENGVAIRSSALAREYTKGFEEMYVQHLFSYKKPNNLNHTINDIEFYMCPDRVNVKDAIIRVIKSAKHKIFFAAFVFTDKDIRDALIEKFNQGVEVWGMFDGLGANGTYSAKRGLEQAGVKVGIDGGKGLLHHKYVVVDPGYSNPTVLTGSMNWTNKASKYNDENFIIVRGNKSMAMDYFDEFFIIWKNQKNRVIQDDPEPGPVPVYEEPDDGHNGYEDGNNEANNEKPAGLLDSIMDIFNVIASLFGR